MKRIDELLRTDPLMEAEEFTGKRMEQDKETLAIGFMLTQMYAQEKENLLSENNDSTFNMSWEKYVKVVESAGFRMIHEEDFLSKDGIKEYLRFYWHELGIFLCCDSFTWGHRINNSDRNSATMYYNWKPNDENDIPFSVLGSHRWLDGVFVGGSDVREALKRKMEILNSKGTFLSRWIKPEPFIGFANREEYKTHLQGVKNYMEKRAEVSLPKVMKLPEEIRMCMFGTLKPNLL